MLGYLEVPFGAHGDEAMYVAHNKLRSMPAEHASVGALDMIGDKEVVLFVCGFDPSCRRSIACQSCKSEG